MKIGIDTSLLQWSKTGTARYLKELLIAINNLSVPDLKIAEFECPRISSVKGGISKKINTMFRETLWLNAILPSKIIEKKLDVFHSPEYYYPRQSKVPVVVTILDIYPIISPKSFRKYHAKSFSYYIKKAIYNSTKIIAISEFTKSEILRFFPDVDEKKIVVIYLGIKNYSAQANGKQYPPKNIIEETSRPYILSVSAIEPRKNFSRLISAFASIARDYPHNLVIVGPSRGAVKIESEIQKHGLEKRVVLAGHVDDITLQNIYKNASLFVFPSLYEGFGLPPLEAMREGCPVIASNNSSVIEVTKGAAIHVDPFSVDSIILGIRKVLDDSSLSSELSIIGKQHSMQFTWELTAKKTIDVYRSILVG